MIVIVVLSFVIFRLIQHFGPPSVLLPFAYGFVSRIFQNIVKVSEPFSYSSSEKNEECTLRQS